MNRSKHTPLETGISEPPNVGSPEDGVPAAPPMNRRRFLGAGATAVAVLPFLTAFRRADVPGDPIWLLNLDCERLRASTVGRSLLAQLDSPLLAEPWKALEKSLGFDLRSKIQALTCYGLGRAPEDAVALVYCEVEPDRLIALARDLPDYHTAGQAPRLIHHWQNAPNDAKEGSKDRTFAAVFGHSIVIFGKKHSAVAQALEVIEQKAPNLSVSKAFSELGAPADTSLLVAGARKMEFPLPPPFDGLARLVKSAALQVGESGPQMTAKLILQADDGATSTQLLNLGQGLIALMKLDSGKPENVKFAESLMLSQEGPRVSVTLKMAARDVAAGIVKMVARNYIPRPPSFPCFSDRNAVIAEARTISDRLAAHIKDWMDGKAPAQIPDSLLPAGVDTSVFKDFRLQRYEEIDFDHQWGVRPAETINFQALHGAFPDPHATYVVLPTLFAPFGTKVVLEGEFPHCRFFDIQMTTSFHPEAYRYGGFGVGEVPIVDADIEPLPGNVNPFRVGADRNATRRSFRVTFDLGVGNPAELERAFQPPWYRAPGNHRFGGAIQYQGPWGTDKKYGHGRGSWDIGSIWIRYYAPDRAHSPMAGVRPPRVYYELPDGRRYFMAADWSAFAAAVNRPAAAKPTAPAEPLPTHGAQQGWDMQFGIFRAIAGGLARDTGWADQEYVRALDKGVTGRGEDLPPPGNYAASATCCNYINYLLRGMSLGQGKVAVLTGRLPTTPRTRNGEAKMEAAQARYWSLTGYTQGLPDRDGFVGAAVHSIMDDEIVTDAEQRYVLVISRPEDRPRNSKPQNGVTWLEWGPEGRVGWTLRWLSVGPEWSFAKTPHEHNLTWAAGWASKCYDASLLSQNHQRGWLGEYQPVAHYLTTAQFEALGEGLRADDVPAWT